MSGTGVSSIRTYNFFRDTTIQAPGTYAANAFVFEDMIDDTPFLSNVIHIINAAGTEIFFSFDGANDHGRILAAESLPQLLRRERRIWLRGTAGQAFRLWAY